MRADLIRRLFFDGAAPLGVRAAGLLLLLYAQPVTAIVRLETRDVSTEPKVMIRLGHDHVPVPRPFDRLLVELLAQANTFTIWHPATRWLFPGRVTGQPVSAQALRVSSKPSVSRFGPARTALLLLSSPNCPLRSLPKRSGSMRAPPIGKHRRRVPDGIRYTRRSIRK